jgi:hypothetical protein
VKHVFQHISLIVWLIQIEEAIYFRPKGLLRQPHPKAPIQAHDTIVINASASRVWQILSDVPNWPTWFSGVKSIHLVADVGPGGTFTWENGDSEIKSTFAVTK